MAPLDDIVNTDDTPSDTLQPGKRLYVSPRRDTPEMIPTDNRLTRAVAPQPTLSDMIAKLRDALLGEQFSQPQSQAENVANAGGSVLPLASRLIGAINDPTRFQFWPERVLRSGATLPGDVATGKVPMVQPGLRREDFTDLPRPGGWTVSAQPQDVVGERVQDMAALAGGGALTERPGAGTLGSGPMKRAIDHPNYDVIRKSTREDGEDVPGSHQVYGNPDGAIFVRNHLTGEDTHFLNQKEAVKFWRDNNKPVFEIYPKGQDYSGFHEPIATFATKKEAQGWLDQHGDTPSAPVDQTAQQLRQAGYELQPNGTVKPLDEYTRILSEQRAHEGVQAAIRDPATGKIYIGASHDDILGNMADTNVWSRLSTEHHNQTNNVGYVKSNGQYVTRQQWENPVSKTARFHSDTQQPGAALAGARPAPVFYSALEHAAQSAKQETMSPEQWAGWLKNQPGVKAEEMQWTGLGDWLKGQKGNVSKADVQKYLDEHKVQVQDVTKEGGRENYEYSDEDMRRAEEEAIVHMRDMWQGMTRAERAEFHNNFDKWLNEPEQLDRHSDIMNRILDDTATDVAQGDGTKYSDYQLPGGTNYREHLLTLPPRQTTLPEGYRVIPMKDAPPNHRVGSSGYIVMGPNGGSWGNGATVADATRSALEYITAESPQSYRSSHWDEPNVLAHVRTNDRMMTEVAPQFKLRNKTSGSTTKAFDSEAEALAHRETLPEKLRPNLEVVKSGNTKSVPTLHLEEIQSDWHQAGRKKGYGGGDLNKFKELDKQAELARSVLGFEAERTAKEAIGSSYAKFLQSNPSQTERAEAQAKIAAVRAKDEAYQKASNKVQEVTRERDSYNPVGKVPDAPFKTEWPVLALKRMIRMAAEEGKSRISWTPGEAQAARYDLSKTFSNIKATPILDQYGLKYEVKGYTKDSLGHATMLHVVPENELPDVVGKEMAQKIVDETKGKKPVEFHGLDLKVGGEGMKGFYDQMLPKMVEKLGKQYGVKVKQYPGQETKFGIVQNDKLVSPEEGFKTAKEARAWALENGWQGKGASIREVQSEMPKLWYFDIPPAMRDASLHKGFPLFMHGVPFPLSPVDHDPFKREKR